MRTTIGAARKLQQAFLRQQRAKVARLAEENRVRMAAAEKSVAEYEATRRPCLSSLQWASERGVIFMGICCKAAMAQAESPCQVRYAGEAQKPGGEDCGGGGGGEAGGRSFGGGSGR